MLFSHTYLTQNLETGICEIYIVLPVIESIIVCSFARLLAKLPRTRDSEI